jgi:hypothetical protein
MRFAYPDEPPTLDPLASGGGSSETRDVLRPVLPALFRLNDELRPIPDLVRAWPKRSDFGPDPFSVKLTLKKATWSDGRQITASDVRFSAGKLRSGPNGYRYRFLTSVDVLSPRTFRLRFDRPVRRWWSLFSIDDMVLPAHAYTSAWANGPTVSGGPFMFASWTKGLDVKLVRNPRYWGPSAKLASLDIEFVPDDETRLQLLREGKIDAFFAEGSTNMGRRARAYGFPETSRPIDGRPAASGVWGPTWIELDLDPSRLGLELRRAVVEGTGPGLAAEIYEDSGRRLDSIPSSFRLRPSVEPWRRRGDVAKAATLAKGTAASFRLGFPDGPAGALANFMHFRLAPAISVEVAGIDAATFERTWLPAHSSPAVLRIRRGADAPDAGAYATTPDEADAESAGAGTQIQTALSAGPWLKVERALHDAATVDPLVQVRTWIVARGGVVGPKPAGTLEGPFVDAATWDVSPAG